MNEQDIAKRLRREHLRVAALAEALRDAISQRPRSAGGAWLATLQEAFFGFRAHMTHRIALTEVGGLYKELIEVRPSVEHQVTHFRQQQRDMLARIEGIHGAMKEVPNNDHSSLNALIPQIEQILDEVDKITEEEFNLVSFVHTEDVGGGEG
jgi:hypothetical protein